MLVNGGRPNKESSEWGKRAFFDSAVRLGRLSRLSGEHYLQRVRQTSVSPDFPTAECYLPDEIVEYQRTGDFLRGREKHATECTACRALLSALVPDQLRVQEFHAEVLRRQRTMEERALEESSGKSSRQWHWRQNPLVKVVTILGLLALPIGSLLEVYTAREPHLALSNPPRPGPPSTEKFAAPESSAQLIVKTSGDAAGGSRLSVSVQTADDGKSVAHQDFTKAAAAASIMHASVLSFKGGTDSTSEQAIREAAVKAIVEACQGNVVHDPVAQCAAGFSALKDQLRPMQNLSIERSAKRPGVFYLSFSDGQTATLHLQKGITMTHSNVVKLRAEQGDPKVLSSRVTEVSLAMAARGGEPLPSARR